MWEEERGDECECFLQVFHLVSFDVEFIHDVDTQLGCWISEEIEIFDNEIPRLLCRFLHFFVMLLRVGFEISLMPDLLENYHGISRALL